MNKAIIVITEFGSMPGRFTYTLQVNGKKKSRGHDAGCDPGAAAAKAMDLAVNYGSGGYAIFAPQKVMDLIPLDMRSR